ncbi:hypothetical protein [Paracraurococcus lichenis]|uniref:Uncharacterized protein n=1 Tax=Paracraurococcus lichenis TaxID=3064888 RepID=A0ABT9EBY6_9PROT|nr:hypothetical protein [Paracraurococcus sp. LOR1-02]MDO9713591.1 hypothetical protein [Paracraurococcus sp. LOR1-02]
MSAPLESDTANRLAQALLAFQKAQKLVLSAHRKLQDNPREKTGKFWAGTGERLKQHRRACAREVMAAYRLFSAEEGIPVARDRRLVNEAYQILAENAGGPEAKPQISIAQKSAELKLSQRLRLAIGAELERREISHPSEIAAILGTSSRQADRVLCRRAWKEGDLALLQAAAARLGLPV